jgi:polyphosphate kinase
MALQADKPAYFLNSELSWLAFNRRVLEEAGDDSNPLLERVKFLAITASNLDEFFEVRFAALLQRIEDGQVEPGPDGRSPVSLRDELVREIHSFASDQYQCWDEQLRPALADAGVKVFSVRELNDSARGWISEYCDRELDPLLTPVTVDPAHPFPRVLNKALCQALLLRRRRRSAHTYLGVITVPRALPRLVKLPGDGEETSYVFLADLVATHAADLFHGYEILSNASFRITRNSNLYLQEEESRSLLESVRTELHNRRKGDAVRMEIEEEASPEIVDRLQTNFGLEPWQVFRTTGPVNLSRLMTLYSETDRPDLKFPPFTPRTLRVMPAAPTIFHRLQKRDQLLHHPFDSYDTVVSFIAEAARDPRVLAIKQTLYRTNEESPIIDALVDAASRKEVSVVVELKARFDEAPNIRWARHLEDSGVQVFHGLVGLKTHCKMSLVVRKDEDGVVRRYAHLGTGNYNPFTATLYTDLSLLTADEEITTAISEVFNFLTAYAEAADYSPLLVAPVRLAEKTIDLIEREAEHARQRRPARIVAKVNGLVDKPLVLALYKASQAGVRIDLIVRGRCVLRPGVRGISSHIHVRSIVGRFLEHSRIFYYANGGDEEIYLGSADWMPRNLYERVEVQFPIKDEGHRTRIRDEILAAYLADNAKARILRSDGTYVSARPQKQKPFNAQEFLIAVAEGRRVSVKPEMLLGRERVKNKQYVSAR